MEKILRRTILQEEEGMLVKGILHSRLHLSVTQVRKAKFRPMGITLNGEHVTVRAKVHAGDVLEVILEDAQTGSLQLAEHPGELDIVYEDDDLLAVNKPAHMPVHPSPGHYDDTLANLLVYTFAQRGEKLVVRTLGRLDRDTTGLILVAKNAPTQTALERQRASGEMKRTYLAITDGCPDPKEGTVDRPIANVPGSLMKREIRDDGAPSRTHYRVLAASDRTAWVKLQLDTGRTHQIRVHMASLGHPLVGDFLYGEEDLYGMSRTALHSWNLSFTHPATGEHFSLTVPPPDDMQTLAENTELPKYAEMSCINV